jgi:hypothetical protein
MSGRKSMLEESCYARPKRAKAKNLNGRNAIPAFGEPGVWMMK